MALLLVLGPLVLPEYRAPDAGRLDLVSAAMSLLAVLAPVFGLKRLAQDGIGPLALAAVLVGLMVGVAFARRHLRLRPSSCCSCSRSGTEGQAGGGRFGGVLAVWGTLFPLQRHTLDPLRDTTPRFPTPPQAP